MNDPSHRWPHSARPVPTPGPLLLLFAETFGQPELARADTILAATLWSLRDHGFVSFGSQTEEVLREWAIRGLWEPTRDVHTLDMVRDKEGIRPGLEGEVLSAFDAAYRQAQKRGPLADHGGPLSKPTIASFEVRCTVVEVVCSWFGRQRFSSTSHVMKQAKRELAVLGYPRGGTESRGPLSQVLADFLERPPQPTAEDLQELRFEAERVVSGWRSFLLNEPGLSHDLLEACGRGIYAMATDGGD